jgi:hypothetical protein
MTLIISRYLPNTLLCVIVCLYICAIAGKFISKAAAEAAARSQARLLERAQAKLLNSGYNSNDYDDIDNDGTTNSTNGTGVPKKGSDDVSTTNNVSSYMFNHNDNVLLSVPL